LCLRFRLPGVTQQISLSAQKAQSLFGRPHDVPSL
jgi:hypothetical protein